MSSNGKADKGRVMTLAEMQALTPAPDPAEAHRRALETRLYESIGPQDVEAWLEKLKELAGKGNLKAMSMLLQLVTRRPAAPQSVTQQAVVVRGEVGLPPPRSAAEALLGAVANGGPAGEWALAGRTGLTPAAALHALQGSEWFEHEADGWHLTAIGWVAWNARREGGE